MIHYSIFPLDQIFYDYNTPQMQLEEIQVEGVKMIVRKESETESTIVQVISGDPRIYLNPRYQPGTKVTRIPKI